MHIDQFRVLQRSTARRDLSSLVVRCQKKYLQAAQLLELRSRDLEALSAHGVDLPIDPGPLAQPFAVLADKYVDRFFSPQIDLLPESTPAQDEKWLRYLYGILMPHLVLDDDVVRNVLRAVGALPSRQSCEAALALSLRFAEMPLPQEPPLTS
jgi:hypothetical protein